MNDPMTHVRVRASVAARLKAILAEASEAYSLRPNTVGRWWEGDEPTTAELVAELVRRHDAEARRQAEYRAGRKGRRGQQ